MDLVALSFYSLRQHCYSSSELIRREQGQHFLVINITKPGLQDQLPSCLQHEVFPSLCHGTVNI